MPATAPPPPGVLMRVAQAAAVVVCVLLGFFGALAFSPEEGASYAVGYAMAPLLLALLVLGWSAKTRRYAPFLALPLVFFSLVGNAGEAMETREEEVDREMANLRGVVSSLLDTAATASAPGRARTPPGSNEAKMVWIASRVLEETPAYLRQLGAPHGVDTDELPAAWGTSRYMADAGSHPEVGRYWEGYGATVADMRRSYPGWVEARVMALADEAGLPRRYAMDMRSGIRERARGEIEALDRLDQMVAAALEYHRFLVSADERIHHDAERDMALFERDAELARANRLQTDLVAMAQAVERVQRESGQAMIDSIQKHLQ